MLGLKLFTLRVVIFMQCFGTLSVVFCKLFCPKRYGFVLFYVLFVSSLVLDGHICYPILLHLMWWSLSWCVCVLICFFLDNYDLDLCPCESIQIVSPYCLIGPLHVRCFKSSEFLGYKFQWYTYGNKNIVIRLRTGRQSWK